MIFSRHNIFSKIKDSDNYFIVNLLYGNADILSPEEAEKLKMVITGRDLSIPGLIENEMIEKGYFIDEQTENSLYRNRYLDFIDSRDEDEVQIFFAPNYTCNFSCSYCYQDQYENQGSENSSDVIDAFYNYVRTKFSGRKKYITLFGGEPLLSSAKQKETINYFLNKAAENNLDVAIVTNGYNLKEYAEIIKLCKIREVQITLDGTEDIHDSRRHLKGGGKTFDKVVEGVDTCLQNNISVNLRIVIDKENIDNLPEIARFAIDKEWTKNSLFKTQIGRNYELHHCQSAPDKLFTRVSLYEKLYELTKQHPHILEFYKPAYSVSKFLFENGELPDPLFDSCPACKTEWAFDFTGNLYSCTATVGKKEESLGTYYPAIKLNNELINEWQSRDVTSINECKSCSFQLACGGGCASVAKNRTGKINSTDCRPIKELLEIGFAAYSKE